MTAKKMTAKKPKKRSARTVAKEAKPVKTRARPPISLAAQLKPLPDLRSLAGAGDVDDATLQAISAEAVTHATSGVLGSCLVLTQPDGGIPSLEMIVANAPSLNHAYMNVDYWHVYVRALAYRYIEESGVVGIERIDWTLDAWRHGTPLDGSVRLLQADGRPALSPAAWVADRQAAGETHAVLSLLYGLGWASTSLREAALERENRTLKQRLREAEKGLPTSWPMLQQLTQSGWNRNYITRNIQQIKQGKLTGNALASQLALELTDNTGTELVASASQLGRMSTWQARALVGVLRLFSSHGTDGRTFNRQSIPVPTALFMSAAGVGNRQSDRLKLFNEALELSRKQIRIGLKRQAAKPAEWKKGDPEPPWEFGVQEAAPFTVTCSWRQSRTKRDPEKIDKRRGLTKADVDRIGAEWLAHRNGEWSGPLPDEMTFTLPDVMKFVFKATFLNADILGALDTAAKRVRGRSESFTGLDWRLFNEVLLTRQTEIGLSYVEREALLKDFFDTPGDPRVANDAAKYGRDIDRAKRGCFAEYRKSVRVLEEAGLVEVVTLDHHAAKKGTKGGNRLRDVFRLLEAAYAPGTEALLSAENMDADDAPEQLALAD